MHPRFGLALLGWLLPALAYAAVTPSLPPAPYALPTGAVSVSTGAQLTAELAKTAPHDIVLRDGTYTTSGFFVSACGHRLYAQNLGRAVLTSGISIGSGGCGEGAVVRGLTFAIADANKAVVSSQPVNPDETSVIETWGRARNVRLLDITIAGNHKVGAGIIARQPEGLQIRRVVARGFRSWGINVDADVFDLKVATPPVLEDLMLSDVSRPVPKSADGLAEACLWVGNTALVSRVRVRDCAWMGVWTGTAAARAIFSDIDIDDVANGIGLYVEHFTTDTTFQRMQIGPHLALGVECEWAAPAWDYRPACDGVLFQDSIIDTRCAGIYLDEGTRDTTARRITFLNQGQGAFVTTGPATNILFDTSGNDYNRMRPGAQVHVVANNPC